MRKTITALTLILLAPAFPLSCRAQVKKAPPTAFSQQLVKKDSTAYSGQGGQQYTDLAKAPDMPYVPQYSGQKRLLRARKIVNPADGTTNLEASYFVREDKNTVEGWYRSALSPTWQMHPGQGVSGERLKDGYKVRVNCVAGPDAEWKTIIAVFFTSFKPQQEDGPPDPKDAIPDGPDGNPPASVFHK